MDQLTTLSLEDELMFRDFVERYRSSDNCNFEDSWGYVLQVTRCWPRKYANESSLVLFTRKEDGALVIPNHFASDEVLMNLIKKLGQEIVLKNVAIEDSVS